MRVSVLGAGISGLTTAIVLQERGHEVRVVAAERGVATTSGAAGAVWYPFRAGPPESVNRWARRSREYLAGLARTVPDAGVDVLTFVELVDDEARPWWAESVDDLRFVRGGLPAGAAGAWVFEAPRVDPSIHLPWLEQQLHAPVEPRRVQRLDHVEGEVVVNCTGLGARTLTGDRDLQAIFGQTVVVALDGFDRGKVISDERQPESIFYAIPRRGEMLLGGCADECADDYPLAPDAALTQEILARGRAHGLSPGAVVRERAGLRPYRPNVRLEREGRIVHNYGHGGAGYTLARGCAEDAALLVEAANG